MAQDTQITIGGRKYPIQIDPNEAAKVIAVEKKLNDDLERVKEEFKLFDQQDTLALLLWMNYFDRSLAESTPILSSQDNPEEVLLSLDKELDVILAL